MTGSKHLALIGAETSLIAANEVAKACGLDHESLALATRDRYHFDLAPALARFPASEWAFFVALDERAVNHARLELVAQVRAAGYETVNLISPQASVSPSARLHGNVLVEAHVAVAANVSIGYAGILRVAALVAPDVNIEAGCTLGERARVGRECTLGTGTTLGPDCVLEARLRVGVHCELLLAGPFVDAVPDRSFFDRLFPNGARILGR